MWYTATSASITNGATVIAVTTGDDISIIQEDSGLIFEGESPVQVKRGYIDGSGDKFIELASPWPYTAKTSQPLVAYPTDASFAEATAELRRVIDTLSVASTVEAQEGTDDEKIMTALKTKQAIDFNVTSLDLLTASDAGLDSGETNYTSGNSVNPLDYGIGGDTKLLADLNDTTVKSGRYFVNSNTLNSVINGGQITAFVDIITRASGARIKYTVWSEGGDGRIFNRVYNSGLAGTGFSDWVQSYHSGNTNLNEFGGVAAGDFIGSVTDRDSGAARFYRPLSGWVSAPSSISVTGTFKIRTRGTGIDVITGIAASDIILDSDTSNCELIANIRNLDGTLINPNLEYVLVSETSSSKITAVA